MAQERLTIVSADCHAGPRRMADYRPYLEQRFLADFDDYCARIDKFEAEIGSGLEGGGAPSYGETGLWDCEARTAQLDGDAACELVGELRRLADDGMAIVIAEHRQDRQRRAHLVTEKLLRIPRESSVIPSDTIAPPRIMDARIDRVATGARAEQRIIDQRR